MFVRCKCCVLSGRALCDGLITRPEESYRLWCVVCDQETSNTRRLKPTTGLWKIQPHWVVTPTKQTTVINDHSEVSYWLNDNGEWCFLGGWVWKCIRKIICYNVQKKTTKYTSLFITYFDHTFLTEMFRPLLRPSSGWNYYRGADKSLARPTSRRILFDG
jgi:hypothetical protein